MRRKFYTAAQLIRKIQKVCAKDGLDPEVAPVHLGTECGGQDITEIYAGGDSEPTTVVIRMARMKL